jgi:hypothetical protein
MLYKRGLENDKLIAIWIASYGSMQLLETFQWLGQSPNYEVLNKVGSIGAAFLLYLHPLGFTVGMSMDKAYQSILSTQSFQLLLGASIAMALFGIYRVSSAYINKTHTFLSKPDSISKHMVWDFPSDYSISIIIIFTTAFLFIAPKFLGFFLALLVYYFLPLFIIRMTMKVEEKNRWKDYSGSYWCWYVAVFSFLFYMRPF